MFGRLLRKLGLSRIAVSRGAGPWSDINESYGSYARSVGFHVDACLPRLPEHKGKVERRVEVLPRLAVTTRRYTSLAELQAATDDALERQSQHRLCPATGLTIDASCQAEQRSLRALPMLPEVFDVVVTRTVALDCTIRFEDRTYSVPFRFCRCQVTAR